MLHLMVSTCISFFNARQTKYNMFTTAAKGEFIKSLGLRGFAMWELGGDHDDILLDSIRSAVGFPKAEEPTSGLPDTGATEPPVINADPVPTSTEVTLNPAATSSVPSAKASGQCSSYGSAY